MFNWGIIRVIWNSSNNRVERRSILRAFEPAQAQHQEATTGAASARRKRRKKNAAQQRRDTAVRGRLAVCLGHLLGKWKFQQERRRDIFGMDDPEI